MTMPNSARPSPCPFCGEAKHSIDLDVVTGFVRVKCLNYECHAQGPKVMLPTRIKDSAHPDVPKFEATAIERWNKRSS
ncbi:Lar family restriction alleviation protein [Litorimonas haliclonae]|uniref:Lar family restriction alleviation protein n=1 Tax=Litorimonas haliclonae TaxID=2081977 RepID=UPI0039F11680